MSPRGRVIVSFLLLAGCAHGGSWKNPSLPPEQAKIDEHVCRQSAEEDMGPQTYTDPGSEKFDSPMQMVDRSEQKQQFSALVADCMERKGYRRED